MMKSGLCLKKIMLTKGKMIPTEERQLVKLLKVHIQTRQHTSDRDLIGKEEPLVTSSLSSSQSWPCAPLRHLPDRCEEGGEPEGSSRRERSCPSPARPAATPIAAHGQQRGSPGVGGRIPSSATVAAQPDRRNLLARGHLWASGRSLSSSSGTDIQPQDRTTMHAFWQAPRAAADLPPCQGGPSSTGERRGRKHFPRSARPCGSGKHVALQVGVVQRRASRKTKSSPRGFWEM